MLHGRELVLLLQSKNIDVYLVSGGFISIIQPIADQLNIPTSSIYANHLKFNEDGEFWKVPS